MSKIGWILLSALLISGCATTPNAIRLTDGEGKETRVVRSMGIDPVMFSGLPWTDDLRSGRFVALLASFPATPETWAEWDPLRIRYQAHAVGADGREYPAYAVFAGYIGCTPRYFVFVEGLQKPETDVKAVTFSTLLDRAYDLRGREVKFEPAKLQNDAAYRKELIQREGTSLTAVRSVQGMRRAFDSWSVYDTKSGQIVTPLDGPRVKYLSGINPQYSYWEKVTGSARVSVNADYVSTVVGIVFDLVSAGSVKAHGFDHGSVMSRSQQGYNLAVLESLRQAGEKSCQMVEKGARHVVVEP